MRPKKKKVRSRRRRRRRSSNGVDDDDLISELPDPILHCILSYLDMTTVIQTSFLSKRWRYLWTTLPFLNFDLRVYYPTFSCDGQGILDFVDRVLILRNQKSNVQSFRFSNCSYYNNSAVDQISTWIHLLIRSNVQVIDLQFHSSSSSYLRVCFFELPKSLFTCKSLTVLKLKFNYFDYEYDVPYYLTFKIPAAAEDSLICLPALKTLHLQSLNLMNSVLELLISRCPVLETLIMNDCRLLDTQELNICNPQIKTLTIERIRMFRVDAKSNISHESCEIKVFAPKLISFSSTDYISYINRYSFVNNSSLVKAEIDTELHRNAFHFMAKNDRYPAVTRKNVIDCLTGVCNVRSLMLSTRLLEFVSEVPDRLESLQINPFCNLSYLKLETSFSKPQIAAITYLLEKCPNLEHLVLKPTEVSFHGMEKKVECWEAELAPQCMMHHLKLIEIWHAETSVNELELLRFLLNNAAVLEKMIVLTSNQQFGNKYKRFAEYRKKLISFRGASSSTEIVFV